MTPPNDDSAGPLCKTCGAPLTREAAGDLCLRCALGNALEPQEVSSGKGQVSGGVSEPAGFGGIPAAGEVRRDACPASAVVPIALGAEASTQTRRAGDHRGSGAGSSPYHRFGDYELLEEIARGGMGVVYRARQVSLDRIVAVKMILFGPLAGAEQVRRFRTEASAAGCLQHPNIVAIHEVGLHEKQHYLVMDYVDGPNLGRLVQEGPLSAKRAAGYVKVIAEAVQYAHERGILHRDLKPSNILLDSDDRPRVVDFGLAKRFAVLPRNGRGSPGAPEPAEAGTTSDLTLSGQVLGSPNYMPPEQAAANRGLVGKRSDVYSLGAILYYLLTGRPPFQAETVAEILSQVLNRDPVSPRLLNSSVPRDLETICLKCLEKEPGKRYVTAHDLAEELGRFLNDQPILARPAGPTEKIWRWCKRKPALAGTVTALLLVAAVGLAGILWQRNRAEDHAASETAQRRRAEGAVIRATRAEELAKKRVLEVAAERDATDKARQEAEAISTFLTQVFRSPDPGRKGRTITVAETLGAAARKLENDLDAQPALRATLQATLGRTYHALGLDREAIPLHKKARDYFHATFGPEHAATLSAMHSLAISSYDAGRRDEALKLREEVLVLRRKVIGPEHPDTLDAMHSLAISYYDAGRRDEALKLREEVLVLRRKVNGPEHRDTLLGMNNLANSYAATGRRDEALKLREDVLVLHRKVTGPEHPDTLLAMNNLANSYAATGRRDEAFKLREEVLALRRKVLGPEHPNTLDAMHNLANSYHATGRRDEALKLREEVLALSRKVLGPEHSDTLSAMKALANSYHATGRRDEATKLQEEALLSASRANTRKSGTHNPSRD